MVIVEEVKEEGKGRKWEQEEGGFENPYWGGTHNPLQPANLASGNSTAACQILIVQSFYNIMWAGGQTRRKGGKKRGVGCRRCLSYGLAEVVRKVPLGTI